VILPTGTYRASEYLDAARSLGVDVVTASEQAQALAATMGDHFLELPLEDAEASARLIVERARTVPLGAVIAVDDQGLLAAALAADVLGLRHNPPAAVRLTRDKAAMREAFAAAGVPQPDFEVVAGGPEAVAAAAGRIGYPVVVKPISLSGSRGVIRADSAAEAEAAARRILPILADAGEPPGQPLVVERFVPGPEVAVEGMLSSGVLEVLTIFDKPDPLDGPFFEETLYLSPTHLPPSLASAVEAVVRSAVAALGLTDGPVHAEVRVPGSLDRGAAAQVLEIAARTIGGRCSKAFMLEDGSSLEALVIATALGLPALPAPPARLRGPSGVLMIPIPSSGTLRSVQNVEEVRALEHVTGVEITIPPGRPVRALPEGDRYLGFVFAAAASRGLVDGALRQAREMLVVDIVPPAGILEPGGVVAPGEIAEPEGSPGTVA
jgi:biotin carboxylase